MLLFIYICIFILNAVAILLTYRFLGSDLEKKEKGIFIIVGIALMYLLVTFVYYLSTKDMHYTTNEGQNLITFSFVPVNSILILPFLASSYKYLKIGKIEKNIFKRRVVLFLILLLVILVIEFFYFKNIQAGILNIISSGTN